MVLLFNELFFPKTDPFTSSLVVSFSFCSSFLLRPVGAIVLGYIGDNFGRRKVILITTFAMAFSCIVIAILPTYAQIGSIATWIITICRMVQGLSSTGEMVGTQLYLTEMTKPPIQYSVVTFVQIPASLGSVFALSIISLLVYFDLTWRIAFVIGAGIAIISAITRTHLKETIDFINAKNEKIKVNHNLKKNNFKSVLALFFIDSMWPICFYFSYGYCSIILKNSFALSAQQIAFQNLIVAIIDALGFLFITCLSYKIHPFKILKIRIVIFSVLILFCPYLLNNAKNALDIFLLQSLVIFWGLSPNPGTAIFFKYFPILKRFTYMGISLAISRPLIYGITSLGSIYLTRYLGHWGVLIIIIPLICGFVWGVKYFEMVSLEPIASPTF